MRVLEAGGFSPRASQNITATMIVYFLNFVKEPQILYRFLEEDITVIMRI